MNWIITNDGAFLDMCSKKHDVNRKKVIYDNNKINNNKIIKFDKNEQSKGINVDNWLKNIGGDTVKDLSCY